MFTAAQKSFLNAAIAGSAQGFQQFMQSMIENPPAWRIEDCLNKVRIETMNYVMQNPHPNFNLCHCSTLLLEHLINLLREPGLISDETKTAFQHQLHDSTFRTTIYPGSNRAGLAFALLEFKYQVLKSISLKDYIASLSVAAHDKEGVIERVISDHFISSDIPVYRSHGEKLLNNAVRKNNAVAIYIKNKSTVKDIEAPVTQAAVRGQDDANTQIARAAVLGCDRALRTLAMRSYRASMNNKNTPALKQSELGNAHRYLLMAIALGNNYAIDQFAKLLLSDSRFFELHCSKPGVEIRRDVAILVTVGAAKKLQFSMYALAYYLSKGEIYPEKTQAQRDAEALGYLTEFLNKKQDPVVQALYHTILLRAPSAPEELTVARSTATASNADILLIASTSAMLSHGNDQNDFVAKRRRTLSHGYILNTLNEASFVPETDTNDMKYNVAVANVAASYVALDNEEEVPDQSLVQQTQTDTAEADVPQVEDFDQWISSLR